MLIMLSILIISFLPIAFDGALIISATEYSALSKPSQLKIFAPNPALMWSITIPSFIDSIFSIIELLVILRLKPYEQTFRTSLV